MQQTSRDEPGDKLLDHEDQRDPFGLGELPMHEPAPDGWSQIKASLEADAKSRRRRQMGAGLAVAACLMLVVGLVMRQPAQPAPDSGPVQTTLVENSAEASALQDLVGMSQLLEQRLRLLREQTSSMPSESAVYVAELEDLVARVDGQLGAQPESLDLWTQRVNLMLDLEFIFQHQFEAQYGRMASL